MWMIIVLLSVVLVALGLFLGKLLSDCEIQYQKLKKEMFRQRVEEIIRNWENKP